MLNMQPGGNDKTVLIPTDMNIASCYYFLISISYRRIHTFDNPLLVTQFYKQVATIATCYEAS